MKRLVGVILLVFGVFFNLGAQASYMEEIAVEDVHTLSNFNYVAVSHMSLNLILDMNQKLFSGHVDLYIKNKTISDLLILDAKNLKITSVSISSDDITINAQSADFALGEYEEVRGQALSIKIGPDTRVVRVFYQTTENSAGLDWINPDLTADKFPMVVTQFQAINARTFVPCQDTPAQKITYDATMHLVSDVQDSRMRILMAAMERIDNGDRSYSFRMTNPIPTYLIALAAGVFEEEVISPRVSIFAEPSIVKRAAKEFVDADNMVQAAEDLFGEYDWKRFDIFIMPPSFSYGGMENPTMTFIGPTVVAGDKSLVDVIAHELAHSWSGNWVTNMNWNEFWINEGTTMYIERLIVAKLYGSKLRDLDIILGQQVLKDNIVEIEKSQGSAFTRLKLELTHDFDPDDAVSHVPYEKGFNFWLALELAYGQPAVVGFLKDYFRDHALGTMDSHTLKRLILQHRDFDGAKRVDIDNWFYGEGLPGAGLPLVKSELIDNVDKLLQIIASHEFSVESIGEMANKFDTKQWSYFLRAAKALPMRCVIELEKSFGLTRKNDEVCSNFYALAIRSGTFKTFQKQINAYLGRVGRIKYVAPIYEALNEVGMKNVAVSLHEANKFKNNHITNGAISRRLK